MATNSSYALTESHKDVSLASPWSTSCSHGAKMATGYFVEYTDRLFPLDAGEVPSRHRSGNRRDYGKQNLECQRLVKRHVLTGSLYRNSRFNVKENPLSSLHPRMLPPAPYSMHWDPQCQTNTLRVTQVPDTTVATNTSTQLS